MNKDLLVAPEVIAALNQSEVLWTAAQRLIGNVSAPGSQEMHALRKRLLSRATAILVDVGREIGDPSISQVRASVPRLVPSKPAPKGVAASSTAQRPANGAEAVQPKVV